YRNRVLPRLVHFVGVVVIGSDYLDPDREAVEQRTISLALADIASRVSAGDEAVMGRQHRLMVGPLQAVEGHPNALVLHRLKAAITRPGGEARELVDEDPADS